MEPSVLKQAVEAGQMLKLLELLEGRSKPYQKHISRIRSALEQLVKTLGALSSAETRIHSEELIVKVLVRSLHSALAQDLSQQVKLNEALQRYRKHGPDALKAKRPSFWRIEGGTKVARELLLTAHEPYGKWLDSVQGWLVDRQQVTPHLLNDPKNLVVKNYSSLVRNAPWAALLLSLNADEQLTLATAGKLQQEYASRQGIEQFSSRYQALCGEKPEPRAALAAARADELRFKVQVRLSSVLGHPRLEPLLDKHNEALELLGADQTDEALLLRICVPHEVTSAQELTDLGRKTREQVTVALESRNAQLRKAQMRRKRKRALDSRREQKELLSKLDPKLLKALKENPGLLAKL